MFQLTWPRRDWTKFAVPCLIVLAAYLIRHIFIYSVGRAIPYVTFYPAVLLSALYGGFYGGVTAIPLSMSITLIGIVGLDDLTNLSATELLAQILFPILSLAISYGIDTAYRVYTEAKQKNARLLELNEELLQQKQSYQTLVENMPFMITRFDREGNLLYAHPSVKKEDKLNMADNAMTKEAENQLSQSIAAKPQHSYFETVFTTKETVAFDSEQTTSYGTNYYHHLIIPEFAKDRIVQQVLVITRDLTLEKQMQKELSRLDRLNIIGEMAASIGHELRNPLTTVRGYLQFFEKKPEFAGHREQLAAMIEELDRANFIITEFLSLAKNKAVHIETCHLNDDIKGILPLLQADAIHSGHQIEFQPSDIPSLNVDKKEIRQVLLNLVRNALEATPPSGKITIKTEQVNKQVVLSVQDTGPGISKEIIDKSGTPFVTTKISGIGLGLSVCYRIAERHKALLDFQTGPAGTTFSLKFRI